MACPAENQNQDFELEHMAMTYVVPLNIIILPIKSSIVTITMSFGLIIVASELIV